MAGEADRDPRLGELGEFIRLQRRLADLSLRQLADLTQVSNARFEGGDDVVEVAGGEGEWLGELLEGDRLLPGHVGGLTQQRFGHLQDVVGQLGEGGGSFRADLMIGGWGRCNTWE